MQKIQQNDEESKSDHHDIDNYDANLSMNSETGQDLDSYQGKIDPEEQIELN